jgi:hypothetical protein
MSTALERKIACDDCGEAGRHKNVLPVMDSLAYLCHDEEKSCYNYLLMRQALPLG